MFINCRSSCVNIAVVVSLILVNIGHAAENLCDAGERVYFTCKTNQKIISLCASPNLSSSNGSLRYLFGKDRQHIELTFPNKPRMPKYDFTELRESSAHAGTQALGFKIGKYSYGIFATRSAYGFNGSGLTIGASGKRIALLSCDENSVDADAFYEASSTVGIPKGDIDFIPAEAN